MPDLTAEEVRAILKATGLKPEDDEDLAEVTHRINAFNEALTVLDPPELRDQLGRSQAGEGGR